MGSTTTIELQPNGLYILISRARPDYPAPITNETIDQSLARGDQFEWGLYWCKSNGIGESRRYRERQGIWRIQTTLYPDSNRRSLPTIEEDVRIIHAVHIANMDKPMNDRLNEDLKPRPFPHSQCSRAQAARSPSQHDRTKLTGAVVEPDDGRSRKWLGQALFMMNRRGYISLKEDATSISAIEREAIGQALRNLAMTPAERTVVTCDHADIRAPGAFFRMRTLEDYIDEEKTPEMAQKKDEELKQEG